MVYRACYIENGVDTIVAVKVMHPGVSRKVELDMEIVKAFGTVLEWIPGMKYLGPQKEIETFCEMMTAQLDLRIESKNLFKFIENFDGVKGVCFPRPVFGSKNVLVERFYDGILLSDWLRRGQTTFDGDIARIGLNAFMKMLLKDNFAHADLHAGILIPRWIMI